MPAMRRTPVLLPIVAVLALVACASQPINKELQAAKTIKTVNETAVTALDFGIIDAPAGEKIQALTRVATADLKRAIAARRSGADLASWDRIMQIVLDTLNEANRIILAKEAPQ